ncbi:hypothetical protein ACFQPA_10830 [Halomarina halobia]|uniref:Integral membrane protein n=1 Tax=Halomarina halobia TaxID=3033386 RepID=A0ABD6AB67_9EURY|nr:hypothetical protein [Halomarina sp. PSR21]
MPDDERGRYAREFEDGTHPPRRLQVLDAAAYALVLTAVVVALSVAVTLALGVARPWVGVKYLLFVVGLLLFGVASVKLRPKAAYSERDLLPANSEGETGFQALVQRLVALLGERYRLAPDERFSDAAKLLLASVGVLAVSAAMEFVFGVTIA